LKSNARIDQDEAGMSLQKQDVTDETGALEQAAAAIDQPGAKWAQRGRIYMMDPHSGYRGMTINSGAQAAPKYNLLYARVEVPPC
jgi:hypothetical protein